MDSILERIYKSALKFLYPLSSEDTYQIIVQEGVKLVGASFGSLIIEKDGELVQVYTTLPFNPKRRKRGFTYQAFHKQQPIIKFDEQFGKHHPQIKKLGVKTDVFIPLLNKGKSVGVLILNSPKTEKLSRKDLVILLLFGSLASLAIRKTQLLDEMKNALEARDLFISMAAHELRTPLTTISGYIQLLKSKNLTRNTLESRWIHALSSETLRLTQLVSELLAVDRIKSGDLQYFFKECSMADIIERARTSFGLTNQRHIIFDNQLAGKSDKIIGDYDKLLQVIINLLENAAKYSNSETSINITLKSRYSDIAIEVQDHGCGISKKDLAKIFDKFYRVKEGSVEGMGIGLHLVKNIVTKHRGEIKIQSKLKKGTKVSILLPKTNL